jgi:hypothetical protein
MTKFLLVTVSGGLGPYTADELAKMEVEASTLVKLDDAQGPYRRCGDIEEIAQAVTTLQAAAVSSLSVMGDDMQARGQMHWGPVKADSCTGNGTRQYSAVLHDIPWGQSWEDACARMPNTINGYYFATPCRCKNVGQMWGEWDVPDASCGQASRANAVIFLKHNEPFNFGHTGWGFKLSADQWCYGATELFGQLVRQPGEDNGVYMRIGSKGEMFDTFRTGNTPNASNWPYQSYKALIAGKPNVNAARAAVEATKKAGYWVNGNNCMNHAIQIINAYAGMPIVPVSDIGTPQHWVPNFWFRNIVGDEKSTSDPF